VADVPRAAPSGPMPVDVPPVVTREIAAEAAVWVARLHGPSRSRAMERECLAWQATSPAHRHAFERCTETWMDVPRVTVAGAYAAGSATSAAAARLGPSPEAPTAGRRLGLGLALAAVVTAAGVIWQPWRDMGTYRTGVGGLQVVVLDDGTRLSLNTDTRVRVEFTAARRSVRVERGEALFEVAKDAKPVHRPFVVRVAASEVVALGTVFAVRMTQLAGINDAVAVTLIEGQVSLRPAADAAAGEVAPAQALTLAPGERVRLLKPAGSTAPAQQQTDRPRLEQVMAWKRSEALFENASLTDAVAEMNRYSRTPIVLTDELTSAEWRISGQYRAGDNPGFARAVAAVHGLVVRDAQGRLELARGP
jgi:transmembrane sensor